MFNKQINPRVRNRKPEKENEKIVLNRKDSHEEWRNGTVLNLVLLKGNMNFMFNKQIRPRIWNRKPEKNEEIVRNWKDCHEEGRNGMVLNLVLSKRNMRKQDRLYNSNLQLYILKTIRHRKIRIGLSVSKLPVQQLIL